VRSIAGAIGFLTTFPAGRSAESFEAFRHRVYVMPLAGVIIGLICGAICYVFGILSISFLAPLAILAVEGINHLDGLSDFGDALFAHGERKLKALKDLNTGAGGTVLLTLWCITVSLIAWKLSPVYLFFTVLSAEISAKSCMLLTLSTSRPLWDGMGKYMMEFADAKSTLSSILAGVLMFVLQYSLNFPFLELFLASMLGCLLVKVYSERALGGVNGDVVGAVNCISIAICFVCAWCLCC